MKQSFDAANQSCAVVQSQREAAQQVLAGGQQGCETQSKTGCDLPSQMSSAQETAPALQAQQEGLRQEVVVEKQVHECADQESGGVQMQCRQEPSRSKSLQEVGRLQSSISPCEHLCYAAAYHCSCHHEHTMFPACSTWCSDNACAAGVVSQFVSLRCRGCSALSCITADRACLKLRTTLSQRLLCAKLTILLQPRCA